MAEPLTPEALAAAWAEEAARVEDADPLRAAGLREHAAQLGRAHAALAAERDMLAAALSRRARLSAWAALTAERDKVQADCERVLDLNDRLEAENTTIADELTDTRTELAQARKAHDTWAAQLTAERDQLRAARDRWKRAAEVVADARDAYRKQLTYAAMQLKRIRDESETVADARSTASAALSEFARETPGGAQ